MNNNTGLLIKPIPKKEFVFGSSQRLKGQKVLVANSDWTSLLPAGEYQDDKETKRSTMACVPFSTNNCLESIFKYYIKNNILSQNDQEWFAANGYYLNGEINFSDRFLAIMSRTTQQGNSLHNVAEAVRKHGLIPQTVWEYPPLYNSEKFVWRDWNKQPPESVKNLGKEFLKRFEIGYQTVYGRQWEKALKYSPIVSGIHAYCHKRGDTYQRCGGRLNHAILVIKPKWSIFDSYEKSGSYIKKMASNYVFIPYGYNFSIKSNNLNFNNKPMKNRTEEFLRSKSGGYYFSKQGMDKVQKIDSIGGILTVLDRQAGKKATNISNEELAKLEPTREFFGSIESDIK